MLRSAERCAYSLRMPTSRDRASRDRAPRSLDHSPDAVVWARKRSGMSQGQLARLINVSAGHMSEIESGSRNAPPQLLQKIAAALNCPVSMLERRVEAASK